MQVLPEIDLVAFLEINDPLSETERAELQQQLALVMTQYVIAKICNYFETPLLQKLEQEPDPEQKLAIIKENVADFDKRVREEMDSFKAAYLKRKEQDGR